jgi:Flp pilus assembly protein TadG
MSLHRLILLARKKRGAVTILFTVGATAIIGMAAFAVETSNWYMQLAEL